MNKKKNIKAVNLDFENCENTTIPISAFDYLDIGQIVQKQNISYDSIIHDNPNYSSDTYLECEWANMVMDLNILEKTKTSYSDMDNSLSAAQHLITWPDICYITLIYDDDSRLSITVPWKDLPKKNKEDIDSNNAYQHMRKFTNKNKKLLQIVIKK